MPVNKQEFLAYEEMRLSGVTNVLDIKAVMMITGLEKPKIMYIFKNYSGLKKEYMNG